MNYTFAQYQPRYRRMMLHKARKLSNAGLVACWEANTILFNPKGNWRTATRAIAAKITYRERTGTILGENL